MAKANWSDVEALVKDWFDQGLQPDRGELVELAYEKDANDDVIDALDTLGCRPIESLANLKQQLEANGALA
jgi:vacuolar-type H+-ATPase subunit I/STV1